MGLGWDLAASRQLAGDNIRPVVVLRVATDPVIRLWSGVGDFPLPADLVEDVDGAIYTGLGEFLPPPQVNALVNGLAERVEFGVSGAAVSGQIAALASGEADIIRDVAVNLGFLILDGDQQQVSPTAWLWDGVADSLKVSRAPAAVGETPVRTLALAVGSLMTGRKRANISYWSDADQRRRSADDAFCQQMRTYSAGTTKTWPI